MGRIKDLECGIRRAENEIEVWKSRFRELETHFLRIKQVEFQKYQLEKAFGVCLVNYDQLSVKYEDKKTECDGIQSELDDLIMRKVYVQHELMEYKKMSTEMKERIMRLEEDRKVIFRSAKDAQERIAYLEEEIRKIESGERDKYAELEKENRELECAKRRAEDEIQVWKKRVWELETQEASRLKHEVELEKELEDSRTKCNGLSMELKEKKMAGFASEHKLKDLMLRKIAVDDEVKECRTMCNGQKERIMVLEKERNILHGKEKSLQERITYLSKELKKRDSGESEKCSQLETVIKDLESGKRRAENGVDVWKKRFRESEAQVLRLNQAELKKRELEKELEAYKTQCHGFCVELEQKKKECVAVEGKLKDLELRKNVVDDELEEYKTRSNEMKEVVMGLEGDLKVICEKENLAQDRITYLEEEIRKMESHVSEKYDELMRENLDLDCGKRRAEGEIEIWSTRFRELETQFVSLKEENSALRCVNSNCNVSEHIKLETGDLPNDEGKKYKNRTLQSEMDSKIDGGCEKNLSNHPSSLLGIRLQHIADPLSTNMQSEPLLNAMENKRNTPMESEVDFGSGVRKKLSFEVERSSSGQLAVPKEEESVPNQTSKVQRKHLVHVSTDDILKRTTDNKMNLTSKKCLKRLCPDQRGEEYRNSYEEDIQMSANSKRRRSLKTVTSESEGEDVDRIPIGKLMMKKLEEPNDKQSLLNLYAGGVTLLSGGQDVEKSTSESGRRLISLKQCDEKKNWTERTFSNDSTSLNYLQMSGISYQNAAWSPTCENGKENVVEDVRLQTTPSGRESLGGIIGNWSDSLDSEDSSSDSDDAGDMDWAFSQVIAMVKRNRLKESRWQFEADMLSSFEEDPQLCMKAVCALYRQQISEKKLMKGSLNLNNPRFNKYDALRVSTLAEFLMDGDQDGDLKKSVKELELFDPKALEDCKRLAKYYSKQLFTIYQNKEDPFFLPRSTGISDHTATSGRM